MGFQVTKAGPDTCQVAMCSCFHELGNVPSLVIQDELKKISLRVSKIISRVQDIRRLNARHVPQHQPSQNVDYQSQFAVNPSEVRSTGSVASCCGTVSKGAFCGICGKKLEQQKASGCGQCGAPDSGGRFCASCGNILFRG